MAGHKVDLSQSWRNLLKLNFKRGETRSDSHAWSAHPTADLLGIVAGIQPAAPGCARLRVAPLGNQARLDAAAATPHGPVSVCYRIANGVLSAEIDRPDKLPGEFVWQGNSYTLANMHVRLELALQCWDNARGSSFAHSASTMAASQ